MAEILNNIHFKLKCILFEIRPIRLYDLLTALLSPVKFVINCYNMLEIIDRILIKSSPEKVYNALINIFKSSENYKKWHKDHICCSWRKGNDFQKNSVLYAEEYLHGIPHKLYFRIISSSPPNSFHYKMIFPYSLVISGGSFLINKIYDDVEFKATLSFRFKFIISTFFKKILESIKTHMKEEGETIKMLIEDDLI